MTLREVALDTETTGLNPGVGHRIVEIGCVELINHVPSGETFQCYLNPERDMPAEAFAVHGLSQEFLEGQPLFSEVVDDFLEFMGDSQLIIHNAEFDMGFINAELTRLERPPLSMDRATDTVRMARSKFPGAPANLDALCKRYQIDLTDRSLHGALKDARLLAAVYLELVGGRQPGLGLAASANATEAEEHSAPVQRPPRPHAPSAEEEAAHKKFLESLTEPLWNA